MKFNSQPKKKKKKLPFFKEKKKILKTSIHNTQHAIKACQTCKKRGKKKKNDPSRKKLLKETQRTEVFALANKDLKESL